MMGRHVRMNGPFQPACKAYRGVKPVDDDIESLVEGGIDGRSMLDGDCLDARMGIEVASELSAG